MTLSFDLSARLALRLRLWFFDQDSADWWIDVGQKPERHLIWSALADLTDGIEPQHLEFIRDTEAVHQYLVGR